MLKDHTEAPLPRKLIVEPTTRCNFQCRMCVKQSAGARIEEGDLSSRILDQCLEVMPGLDSLVFTGIGEPLLHEDIETFAAQARSRMPNGSRIGFQTNGKLLNRERSLSLFDSGVNTICVSVDSIEPALFNDIRTSNGFFDVNPVIESLGRNRAEVTAKKTGGDIRLGVEFVVMKQNLDQLPGLVRWAAQHQLDFIIVSHVVAYGKAFQDQAVFLNNSYESMAWFEIYRKKAEAAGMDLQEYSRMLWKYHKTEQETELYRLMDEFKRAAQDQGVYINPVHLFSEKKGAYDAVRTRFDHAEQLARQYGIELTLPRIRPKTNRRCDFIEEGAVFVTWDGQVSPCYFLWHQYEVMRAGNIKQVSPLFFGDLHQGTLGQIWQQRDYAEFRQKVIAYDYPNCHAWCDTRCDYVLQAPFYQDCYINDIPCCDCYWSLGLLNCLT